jgi:beta-lactamase superfamily II metal-dependent hydrolase
MVLAYVPDVGDGLSMGMFTLSQRRIQVDCGSQQQSTLALSKGLERIDPEVFVLSHLHVDHYNGLLAHYLLRRPRSAKIDEVYFPRIPTFKDRERFALYLFAINQRVMGNFTGSMEADFLNTLSGINMNGFRYRSLVAGDTIKVDNLTLTVLWPPESIDDRSTLKTIKMALSAFEDALAEDEPLRLIYRRIEQGGRIEPYLIDRMTIGEKGIIDYYVEQAPFPAEREDIPEVIERANTALRKAANHLCLAFREDNGVLFLGDLEINELKKSVKNLKTQGNLDFQVLITPHHGTHWQKDLDQIRCVWAITSVGTKLFKRVSPNYKGIAQAHWVTHLLGDFWCPPYCK